VNSRLLFILSLISLFLLANGCSNQRGSGAMAPKLKRISEEMYGIRTDSMQVVQENIRQNQFFSEILAAHNIDGKLIHRISQESGGVFDIRKMRAGQPLTFIKACNNDAVRYVVYEKNAAEFIVYDLTNGLSVYQGRKKVDTRHREVSGLVESSLFDAIEDNGLSMDLAVKLEEAFECAVDFFHLRKGDYFKIVFDEDFINGESIGVRNVHAAQFHHVKKDFYAIAFEQNGRLAYFDEQGNSMRRAFLKAPLKYTRISSRFSKSRFHPVLKYYRAHLGTDYAAPSGTPIYAVGDGVVEKACHEGGNGNNVKIRHNHVYQTQYLHMSRFAKGIRAGAHVTQGQLIGYVGSTGLATGPHLCFRFWKNGQQVDALRVQAPPSDPIKQESRAAFEVVRADMQNRLAKVDVRSVGQTFAER